ncbi:MAG: hypothetical protein JWO94_317 [Verrucomicrobiaceae bacterium]|nr:hypothetical protein [Verrucomicrobiaceae bacterium]
MPQNSRFPILVRLCVAALSLAGAAYAGPPFVTDDPEPVELHHWEIYLATQQYHSADGWSGTAPHVEVNYGALPDVQLHVIAPIAYDRPSHGASHYGYGDTELGFKYRFIHETDSFPQIGIFPLVELPSGNSHDNLGNGKTQVFLPVWIQKEFGKWTTYGGGGYWINPGIDNRDYWYAGWQVQRKLSEAFTAGLEVQYRTADSVDGRDSTALNAGAIWDISDTYHLLFSAGHTVQGRSEFQGYLALQITFGPEDEKAARHSAK